jgi:hypothetical protein
MIPFEYGHVRHLSGTEFQPAAGIPSPSLWRPFVPRPAEADNIQNESHPDWPTWTSGPTAAMVGMENYTVLNWKFTWKSLTQYANHGAGIFT